jgi:Mg-chelatase subunit ChlD
MTVTANKLTAIQGALPLVMKAVGRQVGAQLKLGAPLAMTDLESNTVYLPSLPFDDPEVETLAYGFLIHESGHLRFTERVDHLLTSKFHHSLCNTLEDIRIEREIARRYRGFDPLLKRLVNRLVNNGFFRAPQPDRTLSEKLKAYLLYRLRSEVLGQDALAQYADMAEAQFREDVSPGLAARIGSVIGRAPSMRSTADAAILAGEIVQLIKDERDQQSSPIPPHDQPEPSHGENNEDGADAPQPGVGESSDTTGSDNPIDHDGQSAGPSDSGSPTDGRLSTNGQLDPADRAKQLDDLLNSEDDGSDGDFGQQLGQVLTEEAGKSVTKNGGCGAGNHLACQPLTPENPSTLLSASRAATSALRTKLTRVLEASARRRIKPCQYGYHIHEPQLVEVMLGDNRLFQQKVHKRSLNTAVQMLLDRSGSMSEDDMEIAKQSALAISLSLENTRHVKSGAAAFPGYEQEVDVLKRMGENVRASASRFAGLNSSGGTPLLPALVWATDELIHCKEQRKIMLVITDGGPDQFEECKKFITRCWIGRIEVYGIIIGAGNKAMGEALIPVCCCIEDIRELPRALFTMLQNQLLKINAPAA